MIKFENATNLKDFRKIVESGKYEVKKENDSLLIYHHLYNIPYIYRLTEKENGLYFFESVNDVPFSVLFRSNSNNIEIISGEKNGRKCKADKNLKQFAQILCLANSVLLCFDF